MRAIFVHLTGSRRGNTEVIASEKITVGTDASADLHFDPVIDKNTSSYHAEIKFRECDYVLKDKGAREGRL